MRLFLFAIGGTGARVVRSLTMMLASGVKGLDSSTEIIPIIIDYDLANGDKTRAIKALKSYTSIHNSLYPDTRTGARYTNHFFMTKVLPLSQAGIANPTTTPKDYEFNFGPAGSTIKFADFLKKSAMNADPNLQLTDDLLNALYDASSSTDKDAELELDMAKGFKGNPNIGSVVFHLLREMPEFKDFAGTFNQATDRVFIVSSIFGGTGASGFPEIVNAIRGSNRATLSPAIIGSAIVLPYFDLQNFDPNSGDTGAVDAGSFNAKTRAALGFYAVPGGINDRVNAIYYIGDENHDAYKYNEGEDRQQNDAHVVEFVAATAVLDFMDRTGFIQNPTSLQQINNHDHNAFEFSIRNAQIGSSIKLNDFEQSTDDLVLSNLSAFALAMKYYRDVICGDRSRIANSTAFFSDNRFALSRKLGRGFYHALDEFLTNPAKWGFFDWLDELKEHTHKLYPYAIHSDTEMKKVFTHKTITAAHSYQQNPIKDDTLSREINAATNNLHTFTEKELMKALYDVMNKKYQSVK